MLLNVYTVLPQYDAYIYIYMYMYVYMYTHYGLCDSIYYDSY